MTENSLNPETGGGPEKPGASQEDRLAGDAEEIVRAAYRQVLKREADPVGLQTYAQALKSSAINVRDLVKQLLHSEEWKGRFVQGYSRPATVTAMYDSALARAPDPEAWNQCSGRGTGQGWDAALEDIVNSPEYTDRFGAASVPSDRLGYDHDSLTPNYLHIWGSSFASIAGDCDLDLGAVSAEQVENSEAHAARFILRLLRGDSSLRRRFPHAISERVGGKFFRWLVRNGPRSFRLSDLAIFQIVETFHDPPGKRIYDLYLNTPRMQRFFPLGLLPFGQRRFLSWLTTFGRAMYNLTDEQILWFLQESAEDVVRGLSMTYLLNQTWQEQHPLAFTSQGWKPFTRWLTSNFAETFPQKPPWRVPGILSRAEQRSLEQRCRRSNTNAGEELEGANILSHFCYSSGIRQAALWTKASLERAGVRTSCRDIPVEVDNRTDERTDWLGLEIYPITLLTNSPTPHFVTGYERSGLFRRSNVYRIAYWYWELEKIPEEWLQLAPLINEIWSPTHFVAAAMRSRMPVPVYEMRPGVEIGEIERIPRAALGIPEDHFVFLFAFDLHSQIRRKNPHGVIRAFQQAFTPTDKVSLVIKASGGEHSADLAELQRIARNPKIVLIHTLVSRAAAFGLTEMCDCFVSLHRSEGFGLGMAEAMLMGKPVIATKYSGNLDFMNTGNSLLVDYRLVEIPEDFATYAKGNYWAEPSVDHAASYMRELFENRAAAAALGERAKAEMRQMLSLEAAGQRMLLRMQEINEKPLSTARAR